MREIAYFCAAIWTMTEQLILTVYHHPKWGPLLKPARVEVLANGELVVLETGQASFVEWPGLNQTALDILRLAAGYDDKALMRSYSREKTTTAFLASVQPSVVETYIRPFIERCLLKMVPLLPAAGLALYARGDLKNRTLWPDDRLKVQEEKVSVVFSFVNGPIGLRYTLKVLGEQGKVDLLGATMTVLCQEPAVVVLNKVLYVFEHLDAKKIRPFLTKEQVEVPPASVKTYVKTFVRSCLQHHTVHTEGLDVLSIVPKRQAFLSLESGLDGCPALVVSFGYEGKKYPSDHTRQTIVMVEEQAETTALRWFKTDKDWEQACMALLTTQGLKQVGANHYALPPVQDEVMMDNMYNLVDWLRAHPEVLETFTIEQHLDKQYYLGEVAVTMTVDARLDWFDVQALVRFGAFEIPFGRFRHHILENRREYVLPDGTLAILPEAWFVHYRELCLFAKTKGDSMVLGKHQFRLAHAMDSRVAMPEPRKETLPEVPTTLHALLRPYQKLGFQWLVWLYQHGFGGILADDMGLGKTVQVIAFLAYLEQQATTQPSLIVVPTSLVYNWEQELKRFAPHLKVYTYTGNKWLRSKDSGRVFNHSHVVLTTYGILRNDIDWLETCSFHHLILDESQYVKNPDALTYKAVERLQVPFRLALTGTPVENSLMDLWAQFNLLNEHMLGPREVFKKVYMNPIAKEDKGREAALLALITPFLLRRTKQEVTPELPLLLEETVYCDMSQEQEAVYSKEKNLLRNSLLDEKTWEQAGQASFLTLQGLMRLRLLANHPVMVDSTFRGEAGKFEQVLMRLETLRAAGHKVLVFSAFVRHLKLFAARFEAEGQAYAWLSGSTTPTDREKAIRRFTEDPDVACFLISLKAGGVGLNLTAADYVFILDPWWNPASEMQALSRAHRIGQDKQVFVYRFLTSQTIEEKIRRLQENKSKLAETFVQSGNPLLHLDKEALLCLVE